MTNIFNSGSDDQNTTSEIEGLKNRFKKEDGSIDVDKLLEAKYHADKHIKNIETEQAELREDLKARTTLEDLMTRIEASKNHVNSEQQINTPVTPTSEVDIDKRVDAKLSAWQTAQLHEQNVRYVESELQKNWGPDYSSKLRAKARELGESETDLAIIAQTKPKAFLAMMGATKQDSLFNAAPSSQVRTDVNNKSQGKTYKDFSKLRRENPTLYWDPATQKEMHRLANEYAARGEDFTKT